MGIVIVLDVTKHSITYFPAHWGWHQWVARPPQVRWPARPHLRGFAPVQCAVAVSSVQQHHRCLYSRTLVSDQGRPAVWVVVCVSLQNCLWRPRMKFFFLAMFFVFCGAVFTANLFEDWKICFHCKPSWGAPRLTAVLGHHTGTWTTSICVALVRWRRMICKPKEFYKMLQLEKREILEYEILCAYGVESSVVQNVNVNWGFEPDELSTWVILGSRVQPSSIKSDSHTSYLSLIPRI